MSEKEDVKIICKNKKAHYNFEIEETLEAGIVLVGTEVKSLRNGKANLSDSYGKFKQGELFLVDMHIAAYDHSSRENHDPLRERKLLLHKKQVRKYLCKVTERGYSLVPLKLYFKRGKVKVELALARGKKTYDKREAIKKKDLRREMERLNRYRTRSS
jgi:SsrA-binding protein